MTVDQMTDAELAAMVRNSLYVKGVTFGDGEDDSRFLLVMAVPYGQRDQVDDLPTAIEGFRELFASDDWTAREFQVYDHNASQRYFSAAMEEVEGNRDEANQ